MKNSHIGKVKRTARGFEYVDFRDHYDNHCSVQASSIALLEKPGTSAVWLGIEDAKPMVMAGDASKVGLETLKTTGWITYPIPKEVSLTTRMHLNRKQVAKLIATLQCWLDNDTFAKP